MARRLTDNVVEWFADEAGAVVGAIGYDMRIYWSFMILGRDIHGKFRALNRDVGLSRSTGIWSTTFLERSF
jgi:hypothetical protein